MMEYRLNDRTYGFSYSDIKQSYEAFCRMTDRKFLEKLPEAIHLACFICFIKEIPTQYCLSDVGVVHELVHLLCIPNEEGRASTVKDVRALFAEELRLA